jgi:hypothetical protein
VAGGSNFHIDASNLEAGLEKLMKPAAIVMYAKTQSKNLEAYAKEHRPWTDRTGDARKRLTAYVTDIPHGYRINLAHGVDYGVWLELAMEKRFAILEPTIRLKGPDVVRGMEHLLDRL